jgi:cytochrome c biogenesis protein CcdA
MTSAFGAGLLATVNPCGFVMLPGLIGMQLGSGDDQQSPLERCADGFGVSGRLVGEPRAALSA